MLSAKDLQAKIALAEGEKASAAAKAHAADAFSPSARAILA